MQQELKRLGINNVLITNYFLECYAGSQLVTFDLAKSFKEAGAHVTVAGFIIREPIISLFNSIGVSVINPLSSPTALKQENFDLIWGHHWPILGYIVFERAIKTKYLILSSLSPFEYIESIWMLTNKADLITFNSEENKETQERFLCSVDRTKLNTLKNSLTQEWFTTPSPQSDRSHQLRKIAIISNHIPAELIDAMNMLNQANIEVSPFGLQFKQTLITPEIIDEYDAIITIGHTVQKSLARNIPVFCYDRFGGPGWITLKNIDHAERFNFSGRCSHKKMSGKEIFHEVTNGFQAALNANFDHICQERFSLSMNITKLLRKMTKTASFKPLNSSPSEQTECINYLKERSHNLSVVGAEKYKAASRNLSIVNHTKGSKKYILTTENSKSDVSWLPNGAHTFNLSGFFLSTSTDAHTLRIYCTCNDSIFNAKIGIYSPEIGASFADTPFSYSAGFHLQIPNFFRSREAKIYAELSDNEILHIASLFMGHG